LCEQVVAASFSSLLLSRRQTNIILLLPVKAGAVSRSELERASEYNSLLRPIKGNPTPSGCLYLLLGVHTCRRSTPRLVLEEEYRPSSSFLFLFNYQKNIKKYE